MLLKALFRGTQSAAPASEKWRKSRKLCWLATA